MSLSRDTMPSWELKAALDNLEVEVERLVKENVRLKEALRNIKERTSYMSCTCSFMVDEEIAKVEKDTK